MSHLSKVCSFTSARYVLITVSPLTKVGVVTISHLNKIGVLSRLTNVCVLSPYHIAVTMSLLTMVGIVISRLIKVGDVTMVGIVIYHPSPR